MVKATKCGRFRAREILKETDDLDEAIRKAPTTEVKLPSFGGTLPPPEVLATLRRGNRNKKNKKV